MTRALKYDIPGTDWRRPVDLVLAEGARALFAPEHPMAATLVVEIGFGRGEFLMEMSANRPDVAFLGVELSRKRVLKMARRLARTELQNVRLIEAWAEQVVDAGLDASSVDEFWINFPDPWPKARHARRRLVQPPLVSQLAGRLVPEGIVHVATDDVAYAEQVHEVLSKETLLENVNAPSPWLAEVEGRKRTAYELAWRAEGRPLHFFAYRRLRGGDCR